ncbi:2314_t:CDS:2, partial [Funneliformis caledonium]
TDKTISSLKPLNSNVCDLKDRVRHRVNFAFQNHALLRVDLNFVPRSNLVRKCLEILSYALPVELYYNFKARYLCYQYTKDNDVKSASRRNEWENFVISLLSFFPFSVKSNEGIKAEEIEGWDFLLSSSHHTKFNFNSHLQCIRPIPEQLPTIDDDSIIKMCEKSRGTFFAKNQSDQRFLNFLPAILLSFHLVYQDLKLHTLTQKYVDDILPLLIQLSTFLDWKIYVEYYRINYGLDKKLSIKEDVLMSTTLNSDHPFFSPPDITQWILKCFRSNVDQIKPFPNPMDISRIFSIPIRENILVQNLDCCKRMRQICSIYTKLVREGENATIFEMVKFGFTSKDIESLPFGIVVPLCEAIRKCRENPPEDWPEDAYVLI